ncbi:ssDNA-dependent ATPase MGS1 PWA37_003261 [Arxiozyma heterogenica]|uniref:ssDNA-dependent ATPase MGS1 n=1 Tax=Arxiozyma heterogenica TaxID=278026 RepID=UPI002F0A6F6F
MHRYKANTRNKLTEQKISCPICSKLVPYSSINSHLDLCSQRPSNKRSHNTVTADDGKSSISSILMGPSQKKQRVSSQSTIIDLDADSDKGRIQDDNENADDRKNPELEIKKIAVESVANFSKSSDEDINNIKYLQKISHLPLSEKLRPKTLLEYVGQQHILSQTDGTLYKYIEQGIIPSMILWGPPGVGKTSLARLLTKAVTKRYYMIETSATKANTQELRSIFEKSKAEFQLTKRRIILFIDEIHRFNKSQQDLLLPHVESGDIILIGATTENPSFQLNNALISRCHVFVLEKLKVNETQIVLSRGIALLNKLRKFIWNVSNPLKISRDGLDYIVDVSIGDTRRALNLLEMVEVSTRTIVSDNPLDAESIRNLVKSNSSNGFNTYYDPKGDNHYDTISAFHKAIRGSDENAALYYLGRMLKGGEDPLYISRRMIRIASEDIGIRDNTMLPLAVATHDAVMKIGLPEADLALVQCCVALARAPKSVEIYRAWKQLKTMLDENKYSMSSSEIPMHIRNAPTKLMEELGYHKGYKYNPDYKDGVCKQEYFPQEVLDKCEDPEKDLKFLTGKHFGTKIDSELNMKSK